MSENRLLQLILAPHVSEKTTNAAEQSRQVVFKVLRDATKTEIKAAVELLFNVKVDRVQTMNMKGKSKRRAGASFGRRPHWKKAYVALAPGHDIDFMGAE